ncbi:MAG: alpha/beta fold hydrolase [Candidatus Marinimicrobia bacterium]|nr:alpha/beta fold hydrolase [Candidatus Neomarinimicrobiota bacterium]
MIIRMTLLLFIVLIGPITASDQQWAELGALKLESGATIQDCRIGYRTFGTLNGNKSNAVLFPTWFGGISEHLGNLVGPDKLVDSTRFYIIAIDALGNGVSSSPSNSTQQPNINFPKFNIRDMVNSQYRTLSEILEIDHLYAIIGGSMGGMQTFQWIVSYPDFMDKAVSYVGAPWQTGYGRLVWEAELLAIESGLENKVPLATITEQVALIQIMNAYTPEYRNRKTAPAEVAVFRQDYIRRFTKNFRIYDWAAQLRAMMAHDITIILNGDRTITAQKVKAETFILVSQQDHLVSPGPALEFAELLGAQTLVFNNDCGHLAPGCEMERFVKAVHKFLNN